MKISCPSCSAKYSIADEKVQNRLAKIRCRKCGTSIVIDGNVSPANVYAADGAAAAASGSAAVGGSTADSGTTYSVDLGENDQRQMTVAEIVVAYNSGMVNADTFVWADGFADWTALAQVEELVAALHAAAQQDTSVALTDETSSASASTAPDESPWDQQPSAAGGGADLFGNVASAGGLDDHVPAARPAPERSPFGGGGGLADATGARNESSVLFSLSALTSSASTSRPSVPAPAASPGGNNDDSGLIDLKALTAAAEATAHIPNAVPARPVQTPLAVAPLGGSPLGVSPLGVGVGPSIPPQAAKGNNNVLIIGGFLFAGIVAAAAIMTLGGKDEEPAVAPPAPVLAPAPAPAPAPAAIPTAQTDALPTADAKPPSTGTEQEESAPAATAKPSSKPRPKPSGSSSSSSSPAPAPAAAPAPAPAPKPSSVGKCGCKKDDLMCLMNCAQ